MKKTVFFDVDGTIMDGAWQIPLSAVSAIRRAREKGVFCIVNTGRPFSHIEDSVVDIGFDGYICSCGQHIILGGKRLFRAETKPEVCAEIVSLAESCRLDAYYESEESMRSLILHKRSKGMQDYLNRMIERGFAVDLDPHEEGYAFDKFCIWAHADSDVERFREYAESFYTMINRGGGMFECILRGYSKETGIDAVLKALGAGREHSYAIGDSANDLPMLRCVAHSIAMASSPENVKQCVEFVTGHIHSDGLARALEHYGLLI